MVCRFRPAVPIYGIGAAVYTVFMSLEIKKNVDGSDYWKVILNGVIAVLEGLTVLLCIYQFWITRPGAKYQV